MPLRYITIEQAKEIHKKTIEISGGGPKGIIDAGRLESVLYHIQNDDYYPEFSDKITHLFYCVNKFHCFQDGNKRIAISLSAEFLILNGYVHCIHRFIREMENVTYHVATGEIDKPLLGDIINAIIYDTIDEDEELKLRYLEAIEPK